MTEHDFRTYLAIGAIAAVTSVALVLGQADGLVAAAITALAALGGAAVARRRTGTG